MLWGGGCLGQVRLAMIRRLAIGELTIRQTIVGETSVIRKIIWQIDMVSSEVTIYLNDILYSKRRSFRRGKKSLKDASDLEIDVHEQGGKFLNKTITLFDRYEVSFLFPRFRESEKLCSSCYS